MLKELIAAHTEALNKLELAQASVADGDIETAIGHLVRYAKINATSNQVSSTIVNKLASDGKL